MYSGCTLHSALCNLILYCTEYSVLYSAFWLKGNKKCKWSLNTNPITSSLPSTPPLLHLSGAMGKKTRPIWQPLPSTLQCTRSIITFVLPDMECRSRGKCALHALPCFLSPPPSSPVPPPLLVMLSLFVLFQGCVGVWMGCWWWWMIRMNSYIIHVSIGK